MKKIKKLLETREETNILLAIELLKAQYKDYNKEWNKIIRPLVRYCKPRGCSTDIISLYSKLITDNRNKVSFGTWEYVFKKKTNSQLILAALWKHTIVIEHWWRNKYHLK